MKNILITGGARSGKSHFAQELALRSGKPVLFALIIPAMINWDKAKPWR